MTNSTNEIPVLLLTGYLGSGKTTLLNHILCNRAGLRVAVIVNDIGEVNIDADLIKKGGIVGQNPDSPDLVALDNGCICCSLQMDLVSQIVQLASARQFDYIVIEASGICEPASIAQTICAIPQMDIVSDPFIPMPRLDCIVTVVDALRLRDEWSCGDKLESEKATNNNPADIANLIIDQIEFCNIILLNKSSEVTPGQLNHIRAIIRSLQPEAEIIDTDYCRVNLHHLLATGRFDFERVATSATWIQEIEGQAHDHTHHDDHHHHDEDHHHDCHDNDCPCHHHSHNGETSHYDIRTMVYYRRRPFNLSNFDRFVATSWPENIIRCKGVIYFSHNNDMSYLFETAGRQKKLTEAGLWYATAPEHELRRLMDTEPGLRRDWDPEYGDRMIKLVIIGQDLDAQAISTALDRCLQ